MRLGLSASDVTAKVGADGTEVKTCRGNRLSIFGNDQAQAVRSEGVQFPLYLRIPHWCDAPKVQVDGKAVELPHKPQRFIVIDRTWNDGDRSSSRCR